MGLLIIYYDILSLLLIVSKFYFNALISVEFKLDLN